MELHQRLPEWVISKPAYNSSHLVRHIIRFVGLEMNKYFVTIVDIMDICKMFSMNEYAVSQKTMNEHEKQSKKLSTEFDRYVNGTGRELEGVYIGSVEN